MSIESYILCIPVFVCCVPNAIFSFYSGYRFLGFFMVADVFFSPSKAVKELHTIKCLVLNY